MSEEKRLSKGFYALISLPATALGFALSVQISALSWFLHTQLKLSIEDVGLVWMAGPLAGILGQVVIGLASDQVWFWNGRRRPFILIGGLLAGLMLLALPQIAAISEATGLGLMPVAICVALTLDLAINVGFNPTRSIIADVTPEGNARTQGFTWMQTISGSFGVLAYLVGRFYGKYALVYLGAALVLAFTLIPPFFIKEPRHLETVPEAPGEEPVEVVEVAEPAKTSDFLKIYLAHAFTWLGVQTMFVYIIAFIQGKMVNLNDEGIGQVIDVAFFVLSLVGAVLPALVLEPIAQRIGRVRTHALCLALMAAGYLGIATLATTPSILYVFMCAVGIGWAATVSLPFAIFSEKVNPTKMGTYMGIFNLSVVLPQLIVSKGLGRIIDQSSDKSIVFFICAATLAISSVLWMLLPDRPCKKSSAPRMGGAH